MTGQRDVVETGSYSGGGDARNQQGYDPPEVTLVRIYGAGLRAAPEAAEERLKNMVLRRSRMLSIFAAWMGVLTSGALAQGPSRNLPADLAKLKIRHRTDHYTLAGNISDSRLVEYGRALEFVYREYAKGFSGLITKAIHRPKVRFKVVILSNAADYNAFTSAYFGGTAEHTRGLFVAGVDLLIIRDDPDASKTYEVLFHEAFHQFVHRYAPRTPVWLNEGLATYYGTARATRDGLVFDRPRSWYFHAVAQARDIHHLVPLDELMTASRAAFYKMAPIQGVNFSSRMLHYAQAYTLVAFMLQDQQGRKILQRYLVDLSKAKTPGDVTRITRAAYPKKLLERIAGPWLAFVNRATY